MVPYIRDTKDVAVLQNVDKKIAVYFEISKDEMLKRNHNEDRTKTVPQRVLLQMFDAYKRPSIDEGFNEVYDGRFINCPDFSLS